MPLLQFGQPKYLDSPNRRSLVSFALVVTSWTHLAYAQQGATGAGAAPAPAAPAAPAATETTGPTRSALPQTGNPPPQTGAGTSSGPLPGTIPGSGTTPQASPFALPAPSTTEQREQKSPFSRQGTGASSLFGTPQTSPGEVDAATGSPTETGSPRVLEAPNTFSASGFYGSGGVSLTTGTGRLAKPREKWSVIAGMGFDDNTLQTPTDGGGTDDLTFRQVIPAVEEISTTVTRSVNTGKFRPENGNFIPIFRTESQKVILRPASPEQVFVQVIPGIPDRVKESSVISQLNASYQAQWAKGRQAFTMDARAGVNYYWSRSVDPLEYEGSLSLLYIRRFSPRLQVSTALSTAYQTQPDFSRLNAGADTAGIGGATTSASSKTDLSYRWSGHFSTVTSLTAELRLQEAGAGGTGSFLSYGLGQELRYRWSPRLTYVGEVRHLQVDYLDADNASTTLSILGGADWDLTRRLRTTIRVGQSIRTFSQTSEGSSSPFGEFSLVYQPSRRDTISVSSRYGFEESAIPGSQQLVFRTSLSAQHLFSPKFVASASLNQISYETKAAGAAGAGSNQEVFDASLNLRYFYSRKLKFGTSYGYTKSKTDLGRSDYDRSRIFITGEYEF